MIETNTSAVLRGEAWWSCDHNDCLAWLPTLPADSIDLCFFSPPYEDARTYGINFTRSGQDWVNWMVAVFKELRRVCTGVVGCIVEGQTRKYRWSAVPALLMTDLHRAGFNLRKPPAYYRVGIPGSGGPDWLRNDYEFIVCTSRPGRLPWSDNTAYGTPCKFPKGGEPSHRTKDGTRVNEVYSQKTGRTLKTRRANAKNPSEGRLIHHRHANGYEPRIYEHPKLANPGNVIEVAVGGGKMGHKLAHENEAPFHLHVAEFFVRSFCKPGGIVCDPMSGSGTTGHAAIIHGRRFMGCEVRKSEVLLTNKRLEDVSKNFESTGV